MFSNFIYFIVALITLTLYRPTQTPVLKPMEALLGFVCITALFAIYTRNRFRRLARRVGSDSLRFLDQSFGTLVTRHSILALVVFALDIWLLDLPSYLDGLPLLILLPTLNQLLFLAIFVGYLALVWYFSFEAHGSIYNSDISRGAYVYSNFALCVPILLPWALMFGISDLLQLLPFEFPKRILNSSLGQIAEFLIFLVIAATVSPLLIQRFWRCRPLEPGNLRHRIEALCQRAGVRYADIVYWPIFGGRMITAAVMGLVGRFRYILVTDALLRILDPDEVDQVIAHEIGHVKRKHLLLYMLFLIGFMLISYAVFPLSQALLLFCKPILQLFLRLKINPTDLAETVQAVLLISGIVLYFRFAFGFFIRNFERQADLFVFHLFPSAQPLISTFDKIVVNSGQPADKPNWHHFSIQERVEYLKRCENDATWVERHDRKVRWSIAAFIGGFIILAFGVFQLDRLISHQDRRHISIQTIEEHLALKAPKTQEDALLYGMLGNIYLGNNDKAAAVTAYEKALAIDPDIPDILNNLAWVLATSQEDNLRDPMHALALAERAIALSKAPHIWDTLAEALYANGRIQEAIRAEEQALAMNPDDRQIYEAQMEKFKKKGKEKKF